MVGQRKRKVSESMKKRWKQWLFALVFCLLMQWPMQAFGAMVDMQLFYDGAMHHYQAEEVHITVNGEALTGLDMPPVIVNDRTLVPVRAIFEKLGAEVVWNATSQEVYITLDNQLEVLKIDSKTGLINGLEFTMDVPAKIINDRTMIPARAALEAFSCTVGWDDATRTVSVYDADHKPQTPSGGESASGSGSGSTSGSTSQGATGSVTATSPITVQSVTVPSSTTAKQNFSVNCSGTIEKYNCFLLDQNRIVVDVYNANNGIANANITNTNSAIVTSIRSAQNQTTPERIARVVFDISSGAGYSATLSADKKSIVVSFESNHVSGFSMTESGNSDVITITGTSAPAANIQMLGSPDRLVIDIPNATNQLQSTYSGNLNYVEQARVSMVDTTTTRIVLDLNRMVSYSTATSGNSLVVTVNKSTLDHMSYDSQNHVLTLKNVDGISANSISESDQYLSGQYVLTLNGNYRSTYGYGTIAAGDGYVQSIVVENGSNGNTRFVVKESQILATKIKDNGSTIEISFVNPKEVYDKVVVLDAGHGGSDPGTSGNGMTEKDVNLDILLRTKALFDADGRIKVYVTRDSDTYPTNISRAQMANQSADLFVSIHQNAAENPAGNGIEVLYCNHANETGNKLTSKIAAQFMQNYMVSATGLTDRGIDLRTDLIVLNQTAVPAILIECGFLTNSTDAAVLQSSASRDKIANAIYSAITDMLNQYQYR